MASLSLTVVLLVVASQWTYSNSKLQESIKITDVHENPKRFILSHTDTQAEDQRCEDNPGWFIIKGSTSTGEGVSQCFKVPTDSFGTPVTHSWLEARDYCVGTLKGYLAQPYKYNLQGLDTHLGATFKSDNNFWLGGNDAIVVGQWRWDDGRKIDGGWEPNQPTRQKGENCLYMEKGSGKNSLANTYCDSQYPFICERIN